MHDHTGKTDYFRGKFVKRDQSISSEGNWLLRIYSFRIKQREYRLKILLNEANVIQLKPTPIEKFKSPKDMSLSTQIVILFSRLDNIPLANENFDAQ